ncbi:S8 family serine peptidase [Calothrix sp. PCC 7507]|uniref:S8 family serine peptidase n=1 Tax=Calothrix sp. PCC 7507 TaxID=99598 RepID=UPI00029EC7D2|nr:S8 family serine peptidase [Calothrix sp. PCC 7507]AFY32043.1 Subtilisin [Calothrix sp. PCC 7507]
MPVNYTSQKSFANEGLDVTPLSSADIFHARDDDSLKLSGRSSFDATINDLKADSSNVQKSHSTEAKITSDATTKSYDSNSGYGLVNAGAAVAKSIGQNTFADVPDLGGNNWGADLVKAPEAWAKGYTGQGVVVAVVDTGVDYNHADLKNNIWTNTKEIADNGIDDDGDGYIDDVRGWNFVNNTNEVMDDNSHGTHVSGTIAGENNDFGVTGVAYGAKIMPVKVLDDSGSGSYSAIANGIYYAVNHGANVINLSLGGDFPNSTLESAIDYASKKGVVVVMAAGNNGYPLVSYPAAYANKSGIAVGAVDQNNKMADFSNQPGFSQLAYVTAPGVNVYSTVPGDQYAYYSGTSMATPHVAGVVALMLSANPNLSAEQVRQIITSTAANSSQSLSTSSNTGSLTHQIIADMTGNSLQYPTASFKLSSTNEVNSVTSRLIPISTSESQSLLANSEIESKFSYYDSTPSSNSYDSLAEDNGWTWKNY